MNHIQENFKGIYFGICVQPDNVEEISSAIRYLLDNPDVAKQMGQNGRRAVLEKFYWGIEEKKLIALYEELNKEINNTII
ncbi:MAG: glycosyltransferase family 4 protein [Candidatus Methanofastidiosa archaeon]|nr:glycosyltransferase family 4 protein [Candidatus Methanofastidiosa archaeon]